MILIESGSSWSHRTYECYPDRENVNYELETAIVWITAGGPVNTQEW